MKKITLAFAALFSLAALKVQAQQEPDFTYYMFNKLIVNPGYAGSRQGICATLVYRNQWMKFTGPDKDGAPVSQSFSIHGPFKLKQKADLGAGLHIINDKSGFIGTTGFMASLAYKRKLRFAELGVGLNLGGMQVSIDPKWRTGDPNDPRLPGSSSGFGLDAGLGVYMNALNWYAGVAALHLPQSGISWKAENGGNELKDIYGISSTYTAVAGYNYPITSEIELQPSVIVMTDFAKTIANVSALALYKQKIWGGLNYKSNRTHSVSVLAGAYVVDNLAIGLAYDVATQQSSPFGGSFELMANYCFNISTGERLDVFHKSTRWL